MIRGRRAFVDILHVHRCTHPDRAQGHLEAGGREGDCQGEEGRPRRQLARPPECRGTQRGAVRPHATQAVHADKRGSEER